MSNVFGNLGKKISHTLESAQKDLRHSFAKSLTVAANSIAGSSSCHVPGTKTKLFSTILERSQKIRDHVIDRRNPNREVGGEIALAAGRDEVQEKLAVFARLEKEFCDLIEVYEILLSERIHLEEIFTGNNQLGSLDDLELVGQYYKALQDTSQEIARLTEENESLREKLRVNPISIHENRVLTPVNDGPKTSGGVEFYPTQSSDVESEQRKITSTADTDLSNDQLTNMTEPESLTQNLMKDLETKEERIEELERVRETLTREKDRLTTHNLEQSNVIGLLETQKIALETKVSYLQKQLQDYEGFNSKLKEASNNGQIDLETSKQEIAQLKRKLDLTETSFSGNKKLLAATQYELELLKKEIEGERRTMATENHRLDALLNSANQLLGEERKKNEGLNGELKNVNDSLTRVRETLANRETELIRQHRAVSVDSMRHGLSSRSIDSEAEPTRKSSADNSMRTLKAECERLALENSKLKAASQFEHMRNIVLKYLQLPEQRTTLLPIIASLFRLTKEDLSTIRK